MSINLALILTVLTLLTGIVTAIDKFVWQRNGAKGGGSAVRQTVVEYSRSFFPVLLFVLVIRSFVFEPFRIPSGSMMPTLLQGDFIFVKKYSYGLRLPVSEAKIVDTGEPERGDVVVFRLPDDPSINYIKRVVGLPGDEVTICGLPVPKSMCSQGQTLALTSISKPFAKKGPPAVHVRDVEVGATASSRDLQPTLKLEGTHVLLVPEEVS